MRRLRTLGRGLSVAALPLFLAGAAVPTFAEAAKIPAYRDPPTYKGITTAPALQPPPTPPAVPLAASGTFPDTLVDEAGTAHIVWNDGRGDQDDATVYCRLKRATTSCDGAPVALLWNKTYNEGDSPSFNTDSIGPRIIRVGDQLIVLSQRYPTGSEKPDGTKSSDTVLAWVSVDGGRTWSDASIIGRWALGEVGLIGQGDEVSILNVGQDPLCPGMCVENYRSGEYSAAAGNLATGPDQAYDATLAVAGGVPTAAWGNLTDQITVRRWTGAGSPVDPGTWTQSPPIAGEEPSLAGGPAGTFLMSRAAAGSRPGARAPFVLRALTGGAGAPTPGAPTILSTEEDVQFGQLAQDSNGRLLAAWQQREGKVPGVRLRTTDPSTPAAVRAAARAVKLPARPVVGSDTVAAGVFGPAQTLITGRDNGQIALAAGPDGGGFAVLNHTGGINQAGEIVATGFGALAPTGVPGLGDILGGGTTGKACDTIDFGSFDIKAASCLYHGTGANARKVSTRGEVDLFGLKIIPDVGSTLVIDPAKLTLDVVGQVKILVRAPVIGDVVLWHGKLNVDLSKARPGDTLFDFPIGEYAAKIIGFDVGANIKVRLEQDGVHIPMSLKLPPAFFGASASTEFIADRKTGLHIDSLHLRLGPVPLGAAVLENFDLVYKVAEEIWKGDGALSIAGAGKIAANAEFKMGQFNGAKISFSPNPPVVIGPFVYLLRAGGGFTVDPLHIEVTGAIGGGAAVAGKSPVEVDGKLQADFPRIGPGRFQMDGAVKVLTITAATGQLRYQTDGYADFKVEAHHNFEILTLDGKLDGFIDGTTGEAAASISGKACVNFGIGCLIEGGLNGAISSKGLAICGSTSIANVGGAAVDTGVSFSAGVQFTLEGLKEAGETLAATPAIALPAVGAGIVLAHTHIPCSTGAFYTPPPRTIRQGGAAPVPAVTVAAGLPSQTVLVTGTDAMPAVDLVGPGGTVTGPDAGKLAVKGQIGSSLAFPDANAVLFVLNTPKAGTWTATPRAGSPAIKRVQLSDGYRPARTTARVTAKGRLRSLRYRVANLGAGQQVRFVEAGAFGERVVGTTTRAAGTVPLVAGTLAGGARTITAEVQRDGVTAIKSVVARYIAPKPLGPRPVTGLKVIRKGTVLTAIWRRPSLGAARQLVRLTGAKGTRLLQLVGPRARTVRFAGVRADERVTVEVVGVTKTMVRGVSRRVISAGAKR